MTTPTPPAVFSQEAEEALIGAVLINPELFTQLQDRVTANDFFLLRLRHIWGGCAAIDKRHEKIDFVTLQAELKAAGQLEQIGGAAYLLGLINNTPSSYHAETYAQLVKRASVRRQLLEAADRIKQLASDEQLATEDAMEQAAAQLQQVATITVSEYRSMTDLVNANMARTELAMEKPGALAGIPSVIPKLGALLGGYQAGRLYLEAGRPGMGKTSMLVSEAVFMAQRGFRVAIASLEMTENDLVNALVSVLSGVPVKPIQEGTMTPAQYSEYVKAAGQLGKLPIWIDDTKVTPKQMAAKVRKLQYRKGVDILMVDYIQLMKAPGGVKNEEYDKVTAISIELAELAKTLRLPILAAAQLSREVENRADKRPQMSDLRSSGQLEQDAAVVMFPFRPSFYAEASDTPPAYEEAEIGIAKNRFGPTGMIRCAFRPVLKQWLSTQTVQLNDLAWRDPQVVARAEERTA